MKLAIHGYKEEIIKKYEMSMGDLILTICQGLVTARKTDIEIRMVDCFSGDVTQWSGMNGLLTHDWPADWRVTVYQVSIMHDNKADTDYLKVIFSDDVEMV